MLNEGRLQRGQIVKYDAGFWRVDYVNDSRARIIPLTKRQVVLGDRVFEADRAGVNISPRSVVEIVENLELAADEMELAQAEAELETARRAAKLTAQATAELAAAEAELAAAREAIKAAPAPATLAPKAGKGGGWRVGPTGIPAYKPGSLAEGVMAWIAANPGCATKEIAVTGGNVGACVSRFFQAGLIEKC